jgi:hypothetical protein
LNTPTKKFSPAMSPRKPSTLNASVSSLASTSPLMRPGAVDADEALGVALGL